MNPLRRTLLALLLLAGAASLLAFGILGVGRGGGEANFDGAVLYAAGRTWLRGANPYDHAELSRSVEGVVDLTDIVFFYPPPAGGLCVPLGLFAYPVAKAI